jgi:hypothetical protein
MENGALLGGCLCGSVRYEITASLQQAEYLSLFNVPQGQRRHVLNELSHAYQ